MWSVVSSHSNINRWARSLGLICLVSLKRDLWDWDWKLRLEIEIGNWDWKLRLEIEIGSPSKCNRLNIIFYFLYIYVYIFYIYMYVSFISYVPCNTLQHTATHCNTLQHTATHCNTLQHTATHRNTSSIYICMYLSSTMRIRHHHLVTRSCHAYVHMGWLRLIGSLKLQVSFAKEPYKRYYILQKRLIFSRSLQVVATP